jgi:hypothetical protein
MSGSSKQSEEYRLNMLRRLEKIVDGTPPSEVAEAEKVVANYRKKQAEARQAIPRIHAKLPEPDLCPECWFMHGRRTDLYAVRHPDDPDNYDRWKCKTCGYIEDRDAR